MRAAEFGTRVVILRTVPGSSAERAGLLLALAGVSLLLRARVHDRVAGSPRYPWVVLSVALFGLFSVGFTITILSVSVPRIGTGYDLHRLVEGRPLVLGGVNTFSGEKCCNCVR